MNPLITAGELFGIYKNENTVLVDATNTVNAFEVYLQSHLEMAAFVDVNKDLAAVKDPRFGGRHPLPAIKDFKAVLARLGIAHDTNVIVYDRHFGANAAARFWWMLKATGHNKVQVLDGGYQAAVAHGFPTSTAIKDLEIAAGTAYQNQDWLLPQASMDDVRKAAENTNCLIIDVREEQRYNGVFEPIDLVAGHIPGAINVPYKFNLDASGAFKKPEELAEFYNQIKGARSTADIIVHCGSGVTACHTLFAFEIAGLEIPALYVGSWSEWSRN